ncbi:MAG: hypothetical protein JW774_00845 [Candidatus Aureabacteria bacterium]|nr:hypothetical protein [Candidatus Auribacterota bacterium]
MLIYTKRMIQSILGTLIIFSYTALKESSALSPQGRQLSEDEQRIFSDVGNNLEMFRFIMEHPANALVKDILLKHPAFRPVFHVVLEESKGELGPFQAVKANSGYLDLAGGMDYINSICGFSTGSVENALKLHHQGRTIIVGFTDRPYEKDPFRIFDVIHGRSAFFPLKGGIFLCHKFSGQNIDPHDPRPYFKYQHRFLGLGGQEEASHALNAARELNGGPFPIVLGIRQYKSLPDQAGSLVPVADSVFFRDNNIIPYGEISVVVTPYRLPHLRQIKMSDPSFSRLTSDISQGLKTLGIPAPVFQTAKDLLKWIIYRQGTALAYLINWNKIKKTYSLLDESFCGSESDLCEVSSVMEENAELSSLESVTMLTPDMILLRTLSNLCLKLNNSLGLLDDMDKESVCHLTPDERLIYVLNFFQGLFDHLDSDILSMIKEDKPDSPLKISLADFPFHLVTAARSSEGEKERIMREIFALAEKTLEKRIHADIPFPDRTSAEASS